MEELRIVICVAIGLSMGPGLRGITAVIGSGAAASLCAGATAIMATVAMSSATTAPMATTSFALSGTITILGVVGQPAFIRIMLWASGLGPVVDKIVIGSAKTRWVGVSAACELVLNVADEDPIPIIGRNLART